MAKATVAAVLTALAVFLPAAGQAQDAAAGEKVFRKCAGCHQIGDGATNRTGPVLTGVIGRQAGTYEGYKYSASMIAAGQAGLIWTPEKVAEYLVNPTEYLRKVLNDPKARAKMTFRLPKEADRLNVAAYLATFSAATAEPMVPEGGFCVVNASAETHVFAVETREGDRQVSELAPGESLCAASSQAQDGIVSVYEAANAFEGCSRLVPLGTAEELHEFAEFDRCVWSGHTG